MSTNPVKPEMGQRVSRTSSLGAGGGNSSRLFWGRTGPQTMGLPGAADCEQDLGSQRTGQSPRLGNRKNFLDRGDVLPGIGCIERLKRLSTRWDCLSKVGGGVGRRAAPQQWLEWCPLL